MHLTAKQVHIGELFESRSKLDVRLVRHLLSCPQKAQMPQYLSLCSDKAAAGGFQLQASLLVLPDNTALVAPPQVMCL